MSSWPVYSEGAYAWVPQPGSHPASLISYCCCRTYQQQTPVLSHGIWQHFSDAYLVARWLHETVSVLEGVERHLDWICRYSEYRFVFLACRLLSKGLQSIWPTNMGFRRALLHTKCDKGAVSGRHRTHDPRHITPPEAASLRAMEWSALAPPWRWCHVRMGHALHVKCTH